MCREAGGCSGISSTQLWALSCQSSANASKPNSFICLQQHQPQLFQNWCVKMRGYKIMKIRAWGLIILGLSGFEAGSVFGVFGGRAAAGCQLTLWVQRVLLGREEEEELVGWGGGEEENTSWGKSLIWIWEEVIYPNDGSKHEWKVKSIEPLLLLSSSATWREVLSSSSATWGWDLRKLFLKRRQLMG